MSNIIKGQRIRNETKLKIKYVENKELAKEIIPDKDEKQTYFTLKEIESAKSKARIIIEKANNEKDKIIAKAKDQLKIETDIAMKKAEDEGYTKGYDTGYLEGKETASEIIKSAEKELESAHFKKSEILESIEPEVLDLILDISWKLISDEINYNEDTILLLIKQTLGNLDYDTKETTIKVSPDDYDHVLKNIGQLKHPGSEDIINITKDVKLSTGNCIIETPFGSIESNIDKSYNELKKQMRLIYDRGE